MDRKGVSDRKASVHIITHQPLQEARGSEQMGFWVEVNGVEAGCPLQRETGRWHCQLQKGCLLHISTPWGQLGDFTA